MNKNYLYSGITLLFLVGTTYFYFHQLWSKDTENEKIVQENEDVGSTTKEELEEISTSSLRTYQNEELGIKFQYPSQWGDVTQPFPEQLRIKSEEANSEKILINLASPKTNRPQSNLAYLQVDEVCGLYFQTLKLVGEGGYSISMRQTTGPSSFLPPNECYEMFKSIPEERKEKRKTTYSFRTIVYLEEHEIPEVAIEDYREFKSFVESLKALY